MLRANREQIANFLLDEGFSDWKEKEERGEFLINSPFITDSKKKCGINYKKSIWNDFKTGQGGSFWSFVKKIKSFNSENEARLWFVKNYFTKDDVVSSFNEEEEKQERSYKLLFPKDTRRIEKSDTQYIEYLHNRHISDDMIKDLSIHINETERRVVFPIYEYGKLVFYARRAIDDNPIRWLNSTGEASDPVWNIDKVRDEIWIFEGIFDAIRVYPKGVAIFGNHLRQGQMQKILAKNPQKIVVVGDGDDVGRSGQLESAKKLSQFHHNVWIHLWQPGCKDFGDMKEIKTNLAKFDSRGILIHTLNENTNFPKGI